MVFTHTGRMGDFFATLPIYSAWNKRYNEKVTIVVPRNFPFAEAVKDFTQRFIFLNEFIISDYAVWHFDRGGVPYIFNPNDYGIECEKWINLGFRDVPNKFIASFCAEEHPDLRVDHDFSIQIPFIPELHEKYKNTIGFVDAAPYRDDCGVLERIMVKTELNYHKFSPDTSLWENLLIARHCAYNISAGSAMAVLLGFARIPFSVYTWQSPPNLFCKPSLDVFTIWAPPHEIIKQPKNEILKLLNLRDII
jgi:hypothetical protein